ncbi:response regulator transcription factor [Caballeronia jiangsuensis]|uniref:Response regulator transcription factor n=1 Tax=Caballeronia jiangsuensis TaxID=1458357 RepID=A0ABW9CSP2_9BURK
MRVLVLDDHRLFQAGFQLLLEQQHHAEVLQESSFKEGMKHVLNSKIDVAFVDVGLPDGGDLSALVELKNLGVPVVMMSDAPSVEIARKCIELGASGYLPKTKPVMTLSAMLAAIEAGGVFYTVSQMNRGPVAMPYELAIDSINYDALVKQREVLGENRELLLGCVFRDMPLHGAGALGLAQREYETLVWLVEGLPDKAIANTMGIAGTTVRKYVSRLLGHFHAANRGALIRLMLTTDEFKKQLFLPSQETEEMRSKVGRAAAQARKKNRVQ